VQKVAHGELRPVYISHFIVRAIRTKKEHRRYYVGGGGTRKSNEILAERNVLEGIISDAVPYYRQTPITVA
jgi:hypothetical protein